MSVPTPRSGDSAASGDSGVTWPARPDRTATPVARLAVAAALLEFRRERLADLRSRVAALAQVDMVVVDGERAVLAVLNDHLATARVALRELADRVAADPAGLGRFEDLVFHEAWTVLDEVARLATDKAELAEKARADVQRRLQPWDPAWKDIERAQKEIQRRHLRLDAPPPLILGVRRTVALLRQAMIGDKEDKLLDAWRALTELDTTASGGDAYAVTRENLPGKLRDLVEGARNAAGRLQLTALRGPETRARFEYTLMLLIPTGDQRIGVNVQDSTTIVRADREYFLGRLRGAQDAGVLRYLGRDLAPQSSGTRTDVVGSLRDMGKRLYQLLVPDRMKEELGRHEKTPLTVITNDLELPWELMCDDDGFITLSRPVTRVPVGRSLARRVAVTQSPTGRVALIASAGPHNELQSAISEVRKIREGLVEALGDRVSVDPFVSGTDAPPTGEDFARVLESGGYDIIHYAGHALYDAEQPDQSGLLLDREELCFAQKIQRLLRGNPLVFLNACESGLGNGSTDPLPPETHYVGDPKEGLASAFVYGGALACVATMWPVGDVEASSFAVAFYAEVLAGRPLGWAMLNARAEARRQHPDDPSWAAFVLYGDPSLTIGTPNQSIGPII